MIFMWNLPTTIQTTSNKFNCLYKVNGRWFPVLEFIHESYREGVAVFCFLSSCGPGVWKILLLRWMDEKEILLLMVQKSCEKTSWGTGSLSHYLQGFNKHPNGGWPWDFWSSKYDTTMIQDGIYNSQRVGPIGLQSSWFQSFIFRATGCMVVVESDSVTMDNQGKN